MTLNGDSGFESKLTENESKEVDSSVDSLRRRKLNGSVSGEDVFVDENNGWDVSDENVPPNVDSRNKMNLESSDSYKNSSCNRLDDKNEINIKLNSSSCKADD